MIHSGSLALSPADPLWIIDVPGQCGLPSRNARVTAAKSGDAKML